MEMEKLVKIDNKTYKDVTESALKSSVKIYPKKNPLFYGRNVKGIKGKQAVVIRG